MALSRGQFLKSLGKSLPGYLLGGGAVAAKHMLDKVAAVAGERGGAPRMPEPTSTRGVSSFIFNGPSEGRRVALTFDDGPTPGVTNRILDELQRRKLRATFFVIGNKIAAAPDLVRRMFAEGHTVANHSFTHPHLSKLPDAQVLDELNKTQDALAELLNVRPTWVRPPYGGLRTDQAHLTASLGLRVVLWSVDSQDWSNPAREHIVELVNNEAQPGSIILCHELYAGTAEALPSILDHFEAAGLSQVSLDQLLA